MKLRVIGLLAAAALLSGAFSACAQQSAAPGGSASPAPASASSGGTRADTFILAQGADPRGLDPAYVDDGESAKVMCNIYEGLTRYADDSTEVLPCLADSWTVSDDGLVYTFKLHEGVKFQDGTDFNAEAVKFSFDRQIDYDKRTWEDAPYADMPYASFVFDTVADVKVLGDYEVEITLSQPNSAFLANMAMTMAAPIVSPAAMDNDPNSTALMENPVGTGPYKFVKWNKEENIQLVRNDEYWGEKALTQNVVFRFITDNAARVLALNNNEIDMCDGVDATLVDQIKNGGSKLYEAEGMNINYMAYNTESPIFKDQANRIAVSQAINVPELVESLYQGFATPADTILPTFVPGFSPDVRQIAYDPAAAQAAIDKAGITEVHMIAYSNPRPYNPATGETLAVAIAGYLEKMGIKTTIDKYDWTTYKEKVQTESYDICFYGWTGDNGDPDNFMNLLADESLAMNVSRFRDPVYNEMIKTALAMPNGPDREAKYAEMEKYIAERAIWLPISHGKVLAGYRDGVSGFVFHQTGDLLCKKVVVK